MMAADLAEVARQRQADPARLTKLLRGDLDWIVMKALEKDRSRRYETANGLAMDVQRYLTDEPVLARPPSSLYRFQKMVRRNKLPIAVASAVIATLVIITILLRVKVVPVVAALYSGRGQIARVRAIRDPRDRLHARLVPLDRAGGSRRSLRFWMRRK